MKAIILRETGGVDRLHYEEIEKPIAIDNEILIKVKAFSINPVDIKTRKGTGVYGRLKNESSIILGWDISGEVVETGPNATKFKMGDEVFGMINFPGHGKAYAEYIVAPEAHVALKPSSVSHIEAAATTLAPLTAWQALVHEAKVSAGQRVLIHAAAGGVGHFAVQIAKLFGAYVIGTASDKNKEFLRDIGADEHIDYKKVKFEKVVKDIDLVFDAVGGDVVIRSFDVLKKNGQLITIPSGMNEEWKKIALEKNVNARSYLVHSSGDDMQKLAELLQTKKLIPHISRVYSFDQIAEAHHQIETGSTRGKIVIVF